VYICSKAYELQWVYAHWYDEYVSRTTTQQSTTSWRQDNGGE